MMIRGIPGIPVLVLALALVLVMCGGCMQPDETGYTDPENVVPNATPAAPVVFPAPVIPVQTGTVSAPFALPVTASPVVLVTTPASPADNPEPGGFVRFSGADFSLDYPAAWGTNRTVIPLREYRHSWYDCSVTFAYNLDQELRMFSSPDGNTVFSSQIIRTDRDIWPRTVQGRVVYEDIVNAVLGNPGNCANYPGNMAFTIAGISQVPVSGVSYPAVRADFARINLTGFTQGTGSAYVVTGKTRRGVFAFYSTSTDPGTQADLAQYMFGSLQLDSGF